MASHIRPTAPRADLKQRPEMASLKLLVLKFVTEYIEQWHGSPSLGEIGAALDTNRTRIRRALRKLETEGHLIRVPGPRGLSLPGDDAAALRALAARGWLINGSMRTLTPAQPRSRSGKSVTNQTLLPPPELDYAPLLSRLRGIGENGIEGGDCAQGRRVSENGCAGASE
ncbi:MAG: GntR family transcriptional regulator [Blastomonas fulva]|uniref:GntR family transcriptional regulator n=1 Tax=Blastomonas fulva TaxID=1550728 RepID=UPI0024E1F2F7|nr:GntR family transcriptional regulator [Blastomonas fulva]MDK2757536.1 GntR family transcriptional regulator [Blastomonas fulva]